MAWAFVCMCVCLSVCHTLEPYRNGARYDHEIFTVDCHKDSSFFLSQNVVPLCVWVLLERERQNGVPSQNTLFCRYWLV